MKLLPIPPLPALGAPPPLGLWGSDLLWRYPPALPSPLTELKTQLPSQLSTDPRLWGREDVGVFLRWCEREFDLPKFEMDLFQMNGKALCLLTKTDLAERIPGAGDILHNVLHMLVRDAQMLHRHLPNSPVTPTSRYPLSPHSHPPTPNWTTLAPPDSPFHTAHLQHFMSSNSVTLSPAPSLDSQAGSPPQHQETAQTVFGVQNGTSSSSNQSDSDEDSYTDAVKREGVQQSPPLTPVSKEAPSLPQQISSVVNSWSNQLSEKSASAPNTPGAFMPVKTEFFPNESPEPNTNGRLLWDFLQQLLNDPAQRYSNHIAWKCRDTGVFKIVDPAGLAKLWGIQKNHLSMNYDKMSRALRYYYRVNILRKVQGERHCYQFLRNPTELKSIKNISLLRQTPAPSSTQSASASSSTSASSSGATTTPASSNNINSTTMTSVSSTNHQQHHPSPTVTSSLIAASQVAALSGSAFQTNNFHHLVGQHNFQSASASISSSSSLSSTLNSVKMEPASDMDDMPTDLSTTGDRKYAIAVSNSAECYPLIRNSNGLTTIQLVQRAENNSSPSHISNTATNSQQQHQHPEHHSIEHSHSDDRDIVMPTDLRKLEKV